ncbi:hypothetical protein KSS87_012051, partial [Heliosperma pusillum]
LRKGTLEPSLVEAENAVEIIKVRKDGSGKFKTITDAVKSIDIGNTNRVIISIGPGEYKEKVKIERFKPYITFYGTDPKNMPIISYAGTAAQYGTVDSATVIVESDYFVGVHLVIAVIQQHFIIASSKDFKIPYVMTKETIYSRIVTFEGIVDFIFGEARSIYLNSEIRVIPGDPFAYIVARARKNADGVGGYSFVHCKVTGTGHTAFLARAWMEAARTVYSY